MSDFEFPGGGLSHRNEWYKSDFGEAKELKFNLIFSKFQLKELCYWTDRSSDEDSVIGKGAAMLNLPSEAQ